MPVDSTQAVLINDLELNMLVWTQSILPARWFICPL